MKVVMELIIGGPKFSLEILVKAALLNTQEMNALWIIMYVGSKGVERLAVSLSVD